MTESQKDRKNAKEGKKNLQNCRTVSALNKMKSTQ